MPTRWLLLALPLVLSCSRTTATGGSEATPPKEDRAHEADRQALARIEDDWAKAFETHDTAFFARMIAPDFHGTEDSAVTFGRTQLISNAADTSTQVRGVHDEDRQIRIYGNGTVGVVTGLSRWTVEKGERPGQYSGRYTEIFVKREGRWQSVAGHYSNAPARSEP